MSYFLVNKNFEDISSELSNMQSGVDMLRAERYNDAISRWLQAPDISIDFNKALEARHPGSGRRLIEGETYQQWKSHPNSFLWLNGKPGCGKTILASTVIEDLQASLKCSPSAVIFFYFSFTDSQKQKFDRALRSLLIQLYHGNESARGIMEELYTSCKKGSEQPNIIALEATLFKIIQKVGEMFIVLDALDECESREGLLRWLRGLRDNDINVHVLATSRPEIDIRAEFEELCRDKESVVVHDGLVDADIRSYVHAQVKSQKTFQLWENRPDIQEEIENSLVSKANGM